MIIVEQLKLKHMNNNEQIRFIANRLKGLFEGLGIDCKINDDCNSIVAEKKGVSFTFGIDDLKSEGSIKNLSKKLACLSYIAG